VAIILEVAVGVQFCTYAQDARLHIKAGAAKLKADGVAREEVGLVIDRWNRRLGAGRDMLWSPTTDLCYDPRQPIAYFDLERGNVVDADWRVEDARRLLHGISLVIEEQPALSVSQIAARARKEQQRLEHQDGTLDVVIVDHVHIMAATKRYAGARVHEVSEISAGLKALAKELRIPVLAVAQVIEVDQKAIMMVARTGSRLRAYRGENDPGVVLAWTLAKI
jgi:hypothetical protein